MQHRSPIASSRRTTVLACVLAALASTPFYGLMESHEGNAPLSPANYTKWPGLAEVVNDKSRVYHVWVNGNEEASYRGDTAALERTLLAFAAVQIEERVVILRPGRGEFSDPILGSKLYDWKLGFIGGIARGLFEEQDAELVWAKHPTLTVYTGGDVDLESLKIPKGITQLVQIQDLRERYMIGIKSAGESVRRYAAHLLTEVDPYGTESAAAVRELLRDEDFRGSAEHALAEFKKREDDSDEVRARHKAEVRRIRQFVFAWRYPWLEPALRVAVALATVLLCVTLVAAWARRSRRARDLKSEVDESPTGSR